MSDCPICLEEFPTENNVTIVGCNHNFCKGCIDKLFDAEKLSCPLCRGEINKYIYNNEIIHIITRQSVPVNNTDSDNNNNGRQVRIYYKVGKFIIIQWFVMIILLFYLLSIYENNKLIKLNNTDLIERNVYLKNEFLKCNDENSDHLLINVAQPHSNGNTYHYCEFPKYYIDKCFTRN